MPKAAVLLAVRMAPQAGVKYEIVKCLGQTLVDGMDAIGKRLTLNKVLKDILSINLNRHIECPSSPCYYGSYM